MLFISESTYLLYIYKVNEQKQNGKSIAYETISNNCIIIVKLDDIY